MESMDMRAVGSWRRERRLGIPRFSAMSRRRILIKIRDEDVVSVSVSLTRQKTFQEIASQDKR